MTAFLSDLPVAVLGDRLGLPEREAEGLVETLRRLGIGTLGELAALPAASARPACGRCGSPVARTTCSSPSGAAPGRS
jgi:hypothetical protein